MAMAKAERRQTTVIPEPAPGALFAAILGWLVPGLGHWVLGYRKQAVILAVLLLGSFWGGEFVSSGYAVTRREHPIFFYGQVGNGASAIIANGLQWGDLPAPLVIQRQSTPFARPTGIDRKIPPLLTTGILFTSVSGLLNMLVVLQLLAPRPAADTVIKSGPGGEGSRKAP
jgi:hypothetical protein